MLRCLAFSLSIELVFFQWITIVEGKQGGISSIHGRSRPRKNVLDAFLLEHLGDDLPAGNHVGAGGGFAVSSGVQVNLLRGWRLSGREITFF
jgi:hypothetical protein